MKRKRFLLTMLLSAIGVLLGGSNLWAQWTSKTNLISDPSFELMTAATNLSPDAGGNYSNGIINGWSITGAWSYAQYGVANSNTTIVGIGTSFAPSAGNNYFYTRNNWNANNEYKISQTISGDLPIGYYRIKCKVASYSSSNRLQKLQLSLQEDGKTASSSDATVNNNWQEWSVRIYKESSSTSLTISASMIPGSDGGGNHYCMLLDDFQLEYLPNNYPFIIDDGIYYLYNQYNDNGSNDLHRFLARGKDNGRRAVVDPYGIPIRIINQGNDIVKMQFVDTGEYLYNTWWLYTDDNDNSGNSSTQNLGNTFKIVESTVAGVEGYQFAT